MKSTATNKKAATRKVAATTTALLCACYLSSSSCNRNSHHGVVVDAFSVGTTTTLRPVGLVATTTTTTANPRLPLHLHAATFNDDNDKDKQDEGALIPEVLEEQPSSDAAKNQKRTVTTNPTPVLYSAVAKLFDKDNKNNALATATAGAALALMLAMANPDPALAAMSGGRMGGGSFSSRPSMSRPSGGSYSRGYSSGYSRGYYSSPRTTVIAPIAPITPMYNPFFFNPFPRPFYYGGGGALAVSRGPSLFDLMFLGAVGFVIVNTIRSFGQGLVSSGDGFWSDTDDDYAAVSSALGPGTTVAQISVALQVPNRDDPNSILSVLDRLSQTARTDSRVGVQQLTSQVALEVLRRKSSIVSAATRSKHFGRGGMQKAQRDFNARAVQERGKFESETVSKFGGVDYNSSGSGGYASSMEGSSSSGKSTMAVITIVLAIEGDSTKLNTVNSINDVEDALRKIAADSKVDDCLQSAEILWTPTDRFETLTPRDVVADYPELRTV